MVFVDGPVVEEHSVEDGEVFLVGRLHHVGPLADSTEREVLVVPHGDGRLTGREHPEGDVADLLLDLRVSEVEPR